MNLVITVLLGGGLSVLVVSTLSEYSKRSRLRVRGYEGKYQSLARAVITVIRKVTG